MDYEKIFISKGLHARIVYSEVANTLMTFEEYEKYKNRPLEISIYGTLKDIINSDKSKNIEV